MANERLSVLFGKLPLPSKVIAIGAFFTALSVIMPWYQDIDVFKAGDRFLGVTGPLYLLGILVLGLACFSIYFSVLKMFQKKLPKIAVSEDYIHILAGAACVFLLVLASSIYFHPKFGVNITMKEMRFGMIIAYLGSISVLVGGIMQKRIKKPTFETEGAIHKLIEPEALRRVQKDLEENNKEHNNQFQVKIESITNNEYE